MFPIQSHTVKLILQYISPPSQLSEPLPPHLISTALRQRHHYLQISPTDPTEYLCWPTFSKTRAIELLESLIDVSDEDQPDGYPTRYTSDLESTFAHVQVSTSGEGLRMLFQWDELDGWKYHDLQLMPFPASSFPTLEQAASLTAAPETELERRPPLDFVVEADYDNAEDEDSYWEAYGAGDDLNSPLPPRSAIKSASLDGEDAYWAQFTQANCLAFPGSADSTIPSPLPNNRKLQPANPDDHESGYPFPSQDKPIMIPIDTIRSHRPASKLEPPSPSTLTHLLSIISPRNDIYSPISDEAPSEEPPSAFTPDTPSPDMTAADSDLPTPSSANGDQLASLNGVPFVNGRSDAVIDGEEDKALTDSIKGLYYLWKTGGRKEVDGKGSDAFLRIVQAAIPQE
ncbi:hypothetical protein HYDPIDRAFT_173149 [Hydnomerulius pinastri MD-312]|nr:hypothetical protein HYDPIDRAFT_173149 [Hydnomerulius pinastri MD-312]